MPERVNLGYIVVRLGEFGEVPFEPTRSYNVIVVLDEFEEFLDTILVQMSRQEASHFFQATWTIKVRIAGMRRTCFLATRLKTAGC